MMEAVDWPTAFAIVGCAIAFAAVMIVAFLKM